MFLMRLIFNLVLHAAVLVNNCHHFVMTNTLGTELSHEVSSWSGRIMIVPHEWGFSRDWKARSDSDHVLRVVLLEELHI